MGGMANSDFLLRKCMKKAEQPVPVDLISQLPDGILVYILSFLRLENAARTSVLSKRWIDLWMFVTRLDFHSLKLWEGFQGVHTASEYATLSHSKCAKYVKWVNKVLQSHKATRLDEFRICFDLGKSSQDDIDKWLLYALTRKVRRLDLNFSEYLGIATGSSDSYVFPYDLLGLGEGNSSAVSISGYCGSGINYDAWIGFKTLRVLTFKDVNVSGEVLESLLRNCPFLECLVVVGSRQLNKFKVCGPTLALKHLEISYCTQLLSLTVCNTNIVSLKTTEGRRLVLKDVPMLVNVSIGEPSSKNLICDAISWLSCCLSKLEFLTLQVLDLQVRWKNFLDDPIFAWGAAMFFWDVALPQDVSIPQLTNLKQLTLFVSSSLDNSLIAFTSLVRASPNLEKFILKLVWECDIKRTSRGSKKALNFPLERLKVVELHGYYGRTTEVELVEYFLENAVALEKIIVDSHSGLSMFGFLPRKPEEEEFARNLARQQLLGLVPSDVEVVIL